MSYYNNSFNGFQQVQEFNYGNDFQHVCDTTTTGTTMMMMERNIRTKRWIAKVFRIDAFSYVLSMLLTFQCGSSLFDNKYKVTGSILEQAKGSAYKNYLDCSRGTIVYEIGERPMGMLRKFKSEEQAIMLMKYCKNECSLEQFIESDNIFVMQSLNFIQSLKEVFMPDRTERTDLYLIIGKPGVGKTFFACSLSKSFFVKNECKGNLWDGYAQQEVVILDQFYGSLSPLKLFDLAGFTKLRLRTNGGFTKFNSKAVVIMSTKLPEYWWSIDVVSKYDMRDFDRCVTLTWIWNKVKQSMCFNYKFNLEFVRQLSLNQ
uniref:RNA_helicase domain-containing protein n=1 Tax=Onchocerca volvulus TaxID=6282 RepID=A0A8R1XPN2_ONCVO